MIFSITRAVLLLPWVILCWLGEPFKFEPVGLGQKSDATIREEYAEKKFEHYIPRIASSAGLVIFTVLFLLLWIITNWGWYTIFFIVFCCFCVDVLITTGRYAFFHEKSKEAEKVTGNALALSDSHVWKDTSINGILKKAAEERGERDEKIKDLKAKAKKPLNKHDEDDY